MTSVPDNQFESLVDEELLDMWDTSIDFDERDRIVAELQRRNLFPSNGLQKWEYETGAYPDTTDPIFLQKLLAKREFAESLQKSWKPNFDPCTEETTFEVTPVQRFVANLMSPKTPYMSALLYHGVGVGKTCAAVQIAEAWLEVFTKNEVIIVAPPTIQKGFYRTIFDMERVRIGDDNEPNTASLCTGDKYMKLSNTLYERDPAKIERSVFKLIKRRYKIYGYLQFANVIRDLLKGIPESVSDEQKEQFKKDYLRSYFSGRLLIVDEAHNLRDLADEVADEEPELPGGKAEKKDSAAGKILTPYLRDALRYSEGMKFVMLTATPMYNTYKEIVFMLNLLLINDKKATLIESDIFDAEGNITEGGAKILSSVAKTYVSFMRGENPISFPIRLFPKHQNKLSSYPQLNPRGMELPQEETIFYDHLPIVTIPLSGDVLKASIAFMNVLPPGKGLSTMALEKLVHCGNFIVPETEETAGDDLEMYKRRTEITGLSTIFNREFTGGEVRYKAKIEGGAKWLSEENIERYSPKFKFLHDKLKNSEGVVFVYTRYVNAGALPLALYLEANGYSPYGRKSGLLMNGIQSSGGRQCALCASREKYHTATDHSFTPAYYGILTGDILISPKNEDTIRGERAAENVNGVNMKVIIGSQIASEGVDLRFVRETHVLDSWFHLNKTEQILGRAIRYMSHCALPPEKRNTTVYLYAASMPTEYNRESADLYSYRVGFRKAVQVGNVTRIMKQSAIDCNLNHNAIIIQGQKTVSQIDSQRNIRERVDINDMPFTAMCDWIETCDYTCKPSIDISKLKIDDSTYDEYSSRWRVSKLKDRLRFLFSKQPFYRIDDFWNLLSDIPRMVSIDLLTSVVDNKSFQVSYGDKNGYIRYCNGYYLFQPNVYADLTIPLAIRAAKFPVKRDAYLPIEYEAPNIVEEEVSVNTTETIESMWQALTKWISNLTVNSSFISLPEIIDNHFRNISHENYEVYEKYRQIIEMIEWFHESFHSTSTKNPGAFRLTIIQYFWDQILTLEEQRHLVYSSNLDVSECVRENLYMLGKIPVNRFLDPKDGVIIYLCEGDTICKKSVIDEIIRDRDDPIKAFPVNITTTGSMYGFIVPKNGEMVFKTGEPPMEGNKVGRGQECANVTTMTGHIHKLLQMGEILENAGKGNFGLDRNILSVGQRKIKNSIRACTLLELIIRYVDKEHIDGKRWFFRPVPSYYTGHKGLFRAGKK
jgi:hypothetical protein